MGSPYRTPSASEVTPPAILRSGKWTKDVAPATVQVRWDHRSGHVEVGVHDGRGAPIQFARMSLVDTRDLIYTLEIAIREASTQSEGDPT